MLSWNGFIFFVWPTFRNIWIILTVYYQPISTLRKMDFNKRRENVFDNLVCSIYRNYDREVQSIITCKIINWINSVFQIWQLYLLKYKYLTVQWVKPKYCWYVSNFRNRYFFTVSLYVHIFLKLSKYEGAYLTDYCEECSS